MNYQPVLMDIPTPQSSREIACGKYDKRYTAVFISLFFLPYWPGTLFRIDQFIGIGYLLAIFFTLFSNRQRANLAPSINTLARISSLAVLYVFIRVVLDGKFETHTAKMLNYQVYFAAGMSIYIFHRERLHCTRDVFVNTILALSIPISLITIFQFYFTDHQLVSLLLKWYGGKGDEIYSSEYSDMETVAAMEVLSGTSMTSIFSGKHSLAVFDLFVVALAVGKKSAGRFSRLEGYFTSIVIILAVISGWLSTSKVFFFGVIIFFIFSIRISDVIRRPQAVIAGVAIGLGTLWFFSGEVRVLDDVIETVLSGNILNIFSSRFGGGTDIGYLGESMEVMFEPLTILVGQGGEAGAYKISDSQIRSIVLIGGIPYFLMVYGFVVYLLLLNWRGRNQTPYARPFFALGIALLLGGTGIECYWQARIIPLWIVANMLLAIPQRAVVRRS